MSDPWPRLTPTKPERLVVHCPGCYAELLVGKYGKVDDCVSCKRSAAPAVKSE